MARTALQATEGFIRKLAHDIFNIRRTVKFNYLKYAEKIVVIYNDEELTDNKKVAGINKTLEDMAHDFFGSREIANIQLSQIAVNYFSDMKEMGY